MMRHDSNEFIGKVEKGDAKINASTLFPYDMLRNSYTAERTAKSLKHSGKHCRIM